MNSSTVALLRDRFASLKDPTKFWRSSKTSLNSTMR